MTGNLTWKASLPGLWNDPASWTTLAGPDTIPGATDDATIAQPFNYVVTINTPASAHGLTLNGSGASLLVAAPLTIGGTLAVQSGTLVIGATGALIGGTEIQTGGFVGIANGTLDTTTWQGGLTLAPGSSLNLHGGLSLTGADGTGPGTLTLPSSTATTLTLLDTEVWDNGALTGINSITIGGSGTASLTFGPNFASNFQLQTRYTSANPVTLALPGTLTNAGTLTGGLLSLTGTFANSGTLTLTSMTSHGPLTNSGTVLNSSITEFGTLDNTGTMTNTTVVVGGTLLNQGMLNGFIVSAYAAANSGTLTGASLSTITSLVNDGTISGPLSVGTSLTGSGTIHVANTLAVTGTLGGSQLIDISAGGTILAGAILPTVTIDGFRDATLSGGKSDTLDLTGLPFDGNINAFWSGTPQGGTLTIKDGAATVTAIPMHGVMVGAQFTAASDGTTGTKITVSPSPAAGTLRWTAALPGLWNDGANWTTLAGGNVVPSASDTVLIDQPSNYVVTIVSAASVGDVLLNGTGANLLVAAPLTIGGTLTAQAGAVTVSGSGDLHGGTVAMSGTTYLIGAGGTLEDTTWQGTLSIAPTTSLNVAGGLTLLGVGGIGAGMLRTVAASIDSLTTLNLLDSEIWDNATIVASNLLTITGGQSAALTIGPGALVSALSYGTEQGLEFDLPAGLTNEGTIQVTSPLLTVRGSFDNEGTVQYTTRAATFYDTTNNGLIDIQTGWPTNGYGNLDGHGTIEGFGPLTVTGTIGGSQTIDLSQNRIVLTAGAILPTATLAGFHGAITYVSGPDTIDLTGVPFDANLNAFWSGTSAGGTLTLKDGALTKSTLFMTGIATGAGFGIASDGHGGTNITTTSPACFAQGTSIATTRGPAAVESLRPGDHVLLASGATAPIKWIGHRHTDCRRHPRPWDVHPVRVAASAFAPGQPARDLFLSPDHAVFHDGALIPIRYLVNGSTIAQHPVDSVTYYHVELDHHAVLLAENLPCESYLDTGNRSAFANGGGATHLHPDFARAIWHEKACAPLVLDGPKLSAARRHLLAQAATLGADLTDDPALQILANGRPLAQLIDGPTRHVRLPPAAHSLRLVSRSWTPAHTRADETDTRTLGVAIANLRLDGAPIPLDDPRLSSGWLPPEPNWRWTDGDAGLALAGVRTLSFDLVMAGTYWAHRPLEATPSMRHA